ncbi:hypothetical protein COCCADRAFT_38892 [Bipolaris zeicola 26-R-13]|uniref:Uncharacterized protein n=1 Tax=Cochliobolus carbonum (strain 26-R-13) TaxID=930089 RepID=W6XTM0_COCC2|nr:uncharacterized protein COCCADRAFT_38892 [Bipolaris zeicola 26-R-13]EUC30962.1 hypothetical protein COCCADRAFT_38892 [Bipolaris zeicola 26-R-13]
MVCIDAAKSDVHPRCCMGRACTVASPERRLLRVFPASADASVMSMAFTVPSGVRPNELRGVARDSRRLDLTERSFCSWRPLRATGADQWPGLEVGRD